MHAQLRIYQIKHGLMDEFVSEFQTKIVPPRRLHGFELAGSWIVPDRNQFVWVVTYDGDLEWQVAVDRYYHSPERSNADFDADRYIEAMDVRTLVPVG